jgi:hypothetical protein
MPGMRGSENRGRSFTCRSLDTSLVPRYAARWLSKSSSPGVSGSDAIRRGGRLRRRRQRGASAVAWSKCAGIADSQAASDARQSAVRSLLLCRFRAGVFTTAYGSSRTATSSS